MRPFWLVTCFSVVPMFAAVDFATEIHPILSAKCLPCHSGASPQAGLLLSSRVSALKGGKSGPSLVPGKPAESLLFARVTGSGGSAIMPPTGTPLKESEIEKLRQWIADGAEWPDMTAKQSSQWVAPVLPREPKLPAATGSLKQPVDRILAEYWKQKKFTPPATVSDAQFARRAYFDVWGVPPTPAELDQFTKSRDPRKRDTLVHDLLANSDRYTDHWISYWNDLLRNDIGVVYYGDRKSITTWLQQALTDNKPYKQMVQELLNPDSQTGPEGFLIGVNWRGDINASQTPFMQASQNTAQIFLGINLKCASCHDSFINKYRLSQAYGLAAFFSDDEELELVRCDMKTGRMQRPEFLFPNLDIPQRSGVDVVSRRQAAAALFTHKNNGRLARTIVNRYWQKLVGRGIVEPVDEMDNEPWNADLLDWLAWDFEEHNFDLKHLIERIMTSTAYQLPTIEPAGFFKGPSPRRIGAEEFVDTLSAVTGEWRTVIAGSQATYARDWKLKSSPLTRSLGRPIRDQVYTTRDDKPTTFQALELANGYTLGKLLRRGSKRLLGELPPTPSNIFDSRTMRRGGISFDVSIQGADKLWVLTEDMGSYDAARSVVGWTGAELVNSSGEATPLKDLVPEGVDRTMTSERKKYPDTRQMRLGSSIVLDLKGKDFARVRGRFVVDDSSRPSDIAASVRFFLFTEEPDRDQLVRVTGTTPLPAPPLLEGRSAAETTQYLFRAVLGREPNPAELRLAAGSAKKLDSSGIEDLLWSLLLHPEFQYLP
jgi:hypothetical protein